MNRSVYNRLGAIMLLAVGMGLGFSIAGLLLSYNLNLPAGAVIILIMALAYLLASLVKSLKSRHVKTR